MTKIIEINSCIECPYVRFNPPNFECSWHKNDRVIKEVGELEPKIPYWCPLP